MNSASRTPISSGDLLRELARHKWRHLLLTILIFISSVWFFRYQILSYTSTTTVVVIDGLKYEGRSGDRSLPDYLLPTDQFNRVLQVVNSSGMYNHLLKKFNLYQHYGIDTTNEFCYEKAMHRIRANIEVKKTPYNSITITVKDRYRYTAYEMANEIARFADDLNRKQLQIIQRKRVKVYEKTYAKLSALFELKKRSLDSVIYRFPSSGSESLRAAERDLSQAVFQLSRTTEEFSGTVREQLFILEALSESNAPTIVQQQQALPAGDSLLLPAAGISLLIVLLYCLLIIFTAYLRLQYPDHFSIFKQ